MYVSEVTKLMRSMLKANVALNTIITEIYDTPPESPNFPYITVGESQSYPNDTKGAEGQSHTISINCWSNVSKAECRQITDLIHTQLGRLDISLSSGNRASFYFSEKVTTFEPENRLFRGMVRFRAHVYPEK